MHLTEEVNMSHEGLLSQSEPYTHGKYLLPTYLPYLPSCITYTRTYVCMSVCTGFATKMFPLVRGPFLHNEEPPKLEIDIVDFSTALGLFAHKAVVSTACTTHATHTISLGTEPYSLDPKPYRQRKA